MGEPVILEHAAPLEEYNGMTHSRADILNRLDKVLGAPAQPSKLNDYTDVHASHYQLPEAYIGKNDLLRGYFNSNLVNAPETWQTSRALPIKENHDGLVIQWDQSEYSRNIIPETPYEAASRLAHTRKRTSQARVVRRGQAIMAESDFFRTKEGLKEWYNEIEATRQSTQMTLNYDVMFAILTSSNHAREYDKQSGNINPANMYSNFKREIQCFAALNKGDSHGLDLAFEQARRQMLLYGVTPDMVIMDPRTMLHFAMVPEERRFHMYAGETGVKRYEAYNASDPAFSYRGLDCFVQTSFHTGTDGQDVSMLSRNTQVGEFYVMQKEPKQIVGTDKHYWNRFIYDEENDKVSKIDGLTALQHSCPEELYKMFLAEFPAGDTRSSKVLKKMLGTLIGNFNPGELEAETTSESMASYLEEKVPKFEQLFGSQVEIEKVLRIYGHLDDALKDENLPTTFNWWRGLYNLTVAQGLGMGCQIILIRPFIEHNMLSMVVMKGGESTGTTLYGHSDFQISANTNNKTVEGHFTFHSKAIVYNPKNIYVLEDVQCLDYIAGGNVQFFGHKEVDGTTNAKVEGTKRDLAERLKSTTSMSGHGSMLAFFDPTIDTKSQCFGIGLGPDRWQYLNHNTTSPKNFPGGHEFHTKYSQMFGLHMLYSSVDHVASMTGSYMRTNKVINTVMFRGPSRYQVKEDSKMEYLLNPGLGHFGPDARDGDAIWRRGDQLNMAQTRQLTLQDHTPASVGS